MIKRRLRRIRRKKNSILKNRFFQIAIILIVVIPAIFYVIALADFIQIKEIKIESEYHSPEKVRSIVANNINQQLFGVFDSRSIFLAPLGAVEKYIAAEIPEIRQATISRVFFDSLEIELTIREPVALYCSAGKTACFAIDEEGYLFEQKDRPVASEITIIDLSNHGITIKTEALEPRLLTIITTINKTLGEDIAEYIIFSPKRLDLVSEQGWRVYFNLAKDMEVELAKLKFLLEEEIPGELLEDLEYIDLRFERVFYQ